MGDHEAGPAAHEAVHGLLQEQLSAGVDVRGCLVEDQQAPVGQQGSGNGQKLLLTGGDVRAVLADDRVVAIRQRADEAVAVGALAGLDDLLARGVRAAVGDVLSNRALEQPGLLQDHCKELARLRPGHLGGIPAVNADLAGLNVVEAHQQVDDRGLARAGGTDDGDLLAGLYVHREIADQRLFGVVGETDLVKLHVTLDRLRSLPCRVRLLGQIEQIEHTLRGGLDLLGFAEAEGNPLERGGHLTGEEDDRDHGADGHAVLRDQPSADQGDDNVGQSVDEDDGRLDDGAEEVCSDAVLLVCAVELCVLLLHRVLAVEGLGHGIVREALLSQGEELSAEVEVLVPVFFTQRRQLAGQEDRQRREDDHDESQVPVLKEEEDGDDEHLQEAGHQDLDQIVDDAAHAADVIHHAVDDVAEGRLVHVGHRQLSELLGQPHAQAGGVETGHNGIQQVGIAVGHDSVERIEGKQDAKAGQQMGDDLVGAGLRIGVEPVDQIAQNLRRGDRAADQDRAEHGREGQPAADRLHGANQAAGVAVKEPFLLFGLRLLLFYTHSAPPPVWEWKISR